LNTQILSSAAAVITVTSTAALTAQVQLNGTASVSAMLAAPLETQIRLSGDLPVTCAAVASGFYVPPARFEGAVYIQAASAPYLSTVVTIPWTLVSLRNRRFVSNASVMSRQTLFQ
jgi:hypothetical protein